MVRRRELMFVVLVYDVDVKRVAKVLKKCREYLYWVQNSVFEGEITLGRLKRLKKELLSLINQTSMQTYVWEPK
jgi:CRISPR-associated protein Cas2